jgi:hypothetical protein
MSERVKPLDRDAMGLTAVPGEVVFRGFRSILRDHLDEKADSRWEDRTAEAEYRSQIALRSSVVGKRPNQLLFEARLRWRFGRIRRRVCTLCAVLIHLPSGSAA